MRLLIIYIYFLTISEKSQEICQIVPVAFSYPRREKNAREHFSRNSSGSVRKLNSVFYGEIFAQKRMILPTSRWSIYCIAKSYSIFSLAVEFAVGSCILGLVHHRLQKSSEQLLGKM